MTKTSKTKKCDILPIFRSDHDSVSVLIQINKNFKMTTNLETEN